MRGNILIVEDYADWRELLGGMLSREGHEVTAAATLEEARRLLAEIGNLDLAILDIRLAEADETNEDGMRLLSEISMERGFTRVIVISGHGTMEKQRKAFREFKAFDFFRKEQFDSEEFRKAVKDAVEEAARDRRRARESEYILGRRFEMWRKDND